ncbi:MAG: hypothetical protein QOG71_885 [Pyrinomonadaceae bacterium]|nr:hypothetical protein [Pyrinomonadaceae bacterium]
MLLIPLLGSLAVIASISSCKVGNNKSREPNIEIEGASSWYKETKEEKEYLLKTFYQDETSKIISWPPEELQRYVDISIDATQSSLDSKILYQGKEISWAEYNVRKFAEYLIKGHVLLPGDKITLRIFGSKPNKQEISQDQSLDIVNLPSQIEIASTIYTSRYKDRHLKVVKIVSNYSDDENETVSKIQSWCLQQISNDIYTKSPLFHHIANVKRNTDSKKVKRLLIFITDGHIDFEDLYFSPRDYSEHTIIKIKKTVEELKLRPFDKPDPNTSVIVFGLYYKFDERFRQKQSELIRWFFDQQDPNLVTLITS